MHLSSDDSDDLSVTELIARGAKTRLAPRVATAPLGQDGRHEQVMVWQGRTRYGKATLRAGGADGTPWLEQTESKGWREALSNSQHRYHGGEVGGGGSARGSLEMGEKDSKRARMQVELPPANLELT